MRVSFLEGFLLLVLLAYCDALIPADQTADQKLVGHTGNIFDTIRRALKNADIIDEVIDENVQLKCFVVPSYGKKERPVALGNIFKQSKTKEKPSLKIYCPHVESTPGLTITLTDPDAPSRDDPKWSEMCHWIAIIPISSTGSVEIDLGGHADENDLIEYKPPGPPPKTGYHRYVFILLEGDNSNLTAPEDRQHWGVGKERHGVRDWAAKEGLEVIGANYFIEKNKKQ